MFAGIGGFRTGLTNVGDFFVPIGFCEIDKYAQRAYRALYRTGGEYFCDDATRINTDELPDIDLICAGFPCQPFSVSGRRLGFADTRGTLFHEITRVAEAKRPKFLLLENVPGLLNHSGGETFRTILHEIHELGYSIEWRVLNSANFGVPQQRRRVYAFGYLDSRLSGKVFPLEESGAETLKQIVPGSQGCRVYLPEGVSTCITSQGGGTKTVYSALEEDKIKQKAEIEYRKTMHYFLQNAPLADMILTTAEGEFLIAEDQLKALRDGKESIAFIGDYEMSAEDFGSIEIQSKHYDSNSRASEARIALDLSISKSTVKRAIADLRKAGYITSERRYRKNGANSSLRYTIVDYKKPSTTKG